MERPMEEVQLGIVPINLPDASLSYFWISEDFADPFNLETNREAENIIKDALKSTVESKVLKRVKFNTESDAVVIRAKKAEDIIVVAKVINEIIHKTISDGEVRRVQNILLKHKRPKKQKWQVGDIFSIKLKDGSFTFGQVLWAKAYGARGRLGMPTCSLFEKRTTDNFILSEIINSKVISVVTITANALDSYEWEVIGSEEVTLNKEEVPWHLSGEGGVGAKSFSDDILKSLSEAYHGLDPWNISYKEDFFDEILLPGVKRPATAIVLSTEERDAYRKAKGWDL
ncbi:Imm26 family immunity protein [Ureibacillus manganicus]|uniref:Uncharacterized protein n=1 Tax=Ureibacillus manganicus DSM 26584 TaxID=1384049 RepID=A0A0A3HM38_9BACL|nr:Imm26 family immunity protein [Ureibacillus manganicus]KGR73641.1 hypothetical protein CD29_19120 [Ureibacillus manganicus DSM 26584]